MPAYAAAKGGVAQLTKALSNSWAAHGINVNAVSGYEYFKSINLTIAADCSWIHTHRYE